MNYRTGNLSFNFPKIAKYNELPIGAVKLIFEISSELVLNVPWVDSNGAV